MTEYILPQKVEVSFLLPGVGSHKEIYDMDNENDQFCWLANERLTSAIITYQQAIENIKGLSQKEHEDILKRRSDMMKVVREKVKTARNLMQRSARE